MSGNGDTECEPRTCADDYKLLVERTPDAIAILQNGELVFINGAGVLLLGCQQPAQLLGRRFSDFVRNSDQRLFRRLTRLSVGTNTTMLRQVIIERVDGGQVDVEMAAVAIRWRDQPAVEIVCRDVTERTQLVRAQAETLAQERRARKVAEEASRAKDEALMTLSHELRTPLTPILGWVQQLRREDLDPATYRRALDVIEQNAAVEARLVDELMDSSALLAGKARLQLIRLDLRLVAEAAIESVRPLADDKGINLRFHTSLRSCAVSGDPVRLQQAIWNLLTNAIKFTPGAGDVVTVVEKLGTGGFKLSVSDTGRGIHADFLPCLFEMFTQEDRHSEKGFGLGLAIVRRLVEMHGGSVSAASAGLGRGATFTINLPSATDCGRGGLFCSGGRRRRESEILSLDDARHCVLGSRWQQPRRSCLPDGCLRSLGERA